MKQFIIISLLIVLTSCVAIKEGLSYQNVNKILGNMEFDFSKIEKVQYGELTREYLYYIEPEEITKDELIYYIHGGGWNSGSPEMSFYIADYFNKLGYRVVLTGYPLIYDADIQNMSSSILKSYLYANNSYAGDDKIILGGASAGAHLAVTLYFDNYNDKDIIGKIDKIFSLSGVLDFNQCDNMIMNGMINDITKKDDDLKDILNPINKLNSGYDVDFLLLYSEKDGIVEFENAKVFGDKADSLGFSVEYIDVTDLKHDESYVFPFIYSDMYLNSFDNWITR